MALAEKIKGTGRIAVVFLGDGTLGEGIVYESLNMAALWSIPILFVVEDNGWAQSTPVGKGLAGDMVARASAFGIEAGEIRTTDAERLHDHFGPIVSCTRNRMRPRFEVIHTYRLCHHSKSDDHRPRQEVERHRADDPLPLLRSRIDPGVARSLDQRAAARVDEAIDWARQQPFPDPATMSDAFGETSLPPFRRARRAA
jgi:TPP-dependent pyruvate/acetoin dehydrogenase alpha subunit